MTTPVGAPAQTANARKRMIVALDVETAAEARGFIEKLRGNVGAFKIGLQLFTAAGPGFVREMTASGARVFLDLKFHDIPNTVAKASVEAAKLGVWMFNVHACGGSEMMKRAVAEVDELCGREKIARPLIIGVTVLTSSDAATSKETGIEGGVEEQVVRLARLAAYSGLDGVVASPNEVAAIRKAVAKTDFLTITPGIRAFPATDDDQRRVTDIREAIANGSDYVVIGRPITQADDPVAAVEQLVADAERA